jgi:hypothetical protein
MCARQAQQVACFYPVYAGCLQPTAEGTNYLKPTSANALRRLICTPIIYMMSHLISPSATGHARNVRHVVMKRTSTEQTMLCAITNGLWAIIPGEGENVRAVAVDHNEAVCAALQRQLRGGRIECRNNDKLTIAANVLGAGRKRCKC